MISRLTWTPPPTSTFILVSLSCHGFLASCLCSAYCSARESREITTRTMGAPPSYDHSDMSSEFSRYATKYGQNFFSEGEVSADFLSVPW
jgi:hypothetical protein